MDEILARPAKAERALTNVYRDVWTELNKSSRVKARHGAYAPVVVLGYPQVAHDNRLGPCSNVNMDSAEVVFANDVVLALNASIKRAVASARASGYEVYYVDRTHDALLPDHSVCASGGDQWVNGILVGLTGEWPPVKSESFHPKSTGFRSIGSAVIRWSQSAVRVPATASAKRAAGNSGGLVDDVADRWAASQALERLDLDKGGLRTFSPLQTFAITGSGFAPNTQVAVELHSIPTIVGTLWTDEHGELDGYLTMPPHIEYGQHEIVVSGIGESGDFLQKVVDVQVVPQTPLWVVAVLGASVIAAIGSVVLFLIRRRKDRLLTPSPN
jgi:hypothetical protein